MAFETGKNNEQPKTNKREATQTTEQRRDRRDNDAGRRDREQEEVARPSRGSVMRNRSLNIRGTAGRPAAFNKKYQEIVKDDPNDISKLLVPSTMVDGKRLTADRGFLIYASMLNGSCYWHPIIIETSQTPVRVEPVKGRYRETQDGLEVMNYSSTYDGIDKKFVERMEVFVREEMPCDGDYIFTNVTIIPTEVDLEEENNVRAVTYLAEDANYTVANVEDPYSAANIGKKTTIRGIARFNQDHIKENVLGLPYRADFTIELSELDKDGGKEVLFENESDRLLVTVDGFVTAAYVGPEEYPEDVPENRRYNPACFMPEIAITNINTYHDVEEGQFDRGVLGITAVPFINSDDYWTRSFEPTFGSQEDNRKLSGFLYGMDWLDNLMPEDGDAIDEDSEVRAKWFRRIFKDKSADVCIMVEEGGVDFTMGKLFMSIGEGSTNALERVITSVNEISDDVFADICEDEKLQFNCRDVVPALVRVPTGYFKTKDGNQPIEMVDTLYMLNTIKQNCPDLMVDWYDCTTLDANIDESEALTRLIRVFNEVTGKQFVLKGFITKVYIGGAFLKTMFSAVEDGPLAVRMEADASSSMGRSRRRGQRGDRRDALDNDLAKPRRRDSRTNDRSRRRFVNTSYRSY